MDLVHWMVLLHVTFIVVAIGVNVFPGILLRQIALSGDAPAITRAYGIGMYHGRVGGAALILAAVFGFAAASVSHYPLGSGWLIAGYVTVALLILLGIGFHSRDEAEIFAVAKAGGPDAGAKCAALARRPAVGIINTVSVLLWLLALFAMVFKPF